MNTTWMPRRRRLILGLSLTSVLMAGQLAVGATAADARCAGVNKPVRSTLGIGTPIVIEEPIRGTCNNNNLYQATVRRNAAVPGVGMVSVYIQNGGIWRQLQYTNSPTGARYSYTDNNSNSLMTLCWYEPAAGAGRAHCGWGATYGPPGTTPASRPDIYNQPGYHGVNFGF